MVDGGIREIDQKFSNGLMFPGDPNGSAAEVVNCCCVSNTRAKWALDESELNTLKERAEYFGLDKTQNFEEYKKNYLKATESLNNKAKSGIITSDEKYRMIGADGKEKYDYVKSDEIERLQDGEAITEHFKYSDKFGNTKSPIDSSFLEFSLDTQKEIAEGLQYAKETFGLQTMPTSVVRGKPKSNAWGSYLPSERKITLIPGLDKNISEAFPTVVHEMTHFADHINLNISADIYKNALKNIGVRAGSKDASNLTQWIVGFSNSVDAKNPAEILAYSVQREATGKGNKLSAEILKLFVEGAKK